MLTWLDQTAARLQSYPLWQVLVELLVIGAIVHVALRFLRGTRAAGALGALLVLLLVVAALVSLASRRGLFPRLSELSQRFLGFSAIALLVIFQPELRRALFRIAEIPIARPLLRGMSASAQLEPLVNAVVNAAAFLSKNRFGAIIAIERQIGLRELLDNATPLNADVSAELLQSIFWPNNPLHDMGVVIRGRKIVAAGVQFPLADTLEVRDPTLGTRHRAAVGLSRASDALVIVISEETGAISLCERGQLARWLTPDALRTELLRLLRVNATQAAAPLDHHSGDGPAGDTGAGIVVDDGRERPHDADESLGRTA